MAFDYIDYTRAATAPGVSVVIPGGLSWSQVFKPGQWLNPIEISPGSQLRFTNTDGSITYVYGTGLTIDPVTKLPPYNLMTNQYEGGLITSMVRLSADGVTVYETIDFHDEPLGNDNFLGNLFTDGVSSWITAGDDFYSLNQTSDITEEEASKNIDFVTVSGTSFTLGANVEDLTATTTAAFTGVGNDRDNVIISGIGDDKLSGMAGKDTLNGGLGRDIMMGGSDDDTYFVDNAGDKTIELSRQGTDFVITTLADYVLAANVEGLVFTDTASKHTGTGNASDNTLVGSDQVDRLTGLSGNDILDGGKNDGAAIDSLVGGFGDDAYYLTGTVADAIVEFKGQGKADAVFITQLASYTLSSELENLYNIGTTGAFTGTGNASDNTLVGGADSDTLYGLDGKDRLVGSAKGADGFADDLYGGLGNDTYIVYESSDVAHESADQGRSDLVFSYAMAYTLGANVENLTIKDGVADDVRFGGGNASANILIGDISDDTLDASHVDGQRDTLAGGKGNDTYLIDAGDRVTEKSKQGHDTVLTSIASYRISRNIEDLTFTGNGVHTGFGNAFGNALIGGTGADVLNGLAGDDRLYGGADAIVDTLAGGTGNDTYVIADSVADNLVELRKQGIDTVEISDGSYTGYTLAENFENLTITFTGTFIGNGNSAANSLTGGEGANDLYGNDGDDILDGGVKNLKGNIVADGEIDILVGGLGNDTYAVRELTDVLVEAIDEGIDTIDSYLKDYALTDAVNIENLTLKGGSTGDNRTGTGDIYANVITGDISNDELDGGLNDISVKGYDTLAGGKGDDIYIVNSLTDVVIERRDEGNDTVKTALLVYTLAANTDTLILVGPTAQTGIGNALDNTLMGSEFASGDGIVDSLAGGRGNDRYLLQDNVLDTITEVRGQGIDTVALDANYITSYTLSSQVENLEVSGSAAFIGTGNELGNTFIDLNLSGITFAGLRGNDTYEISTSNITILENEREGTDTVIAHNIKAYTLADNVERLTIVGGSKALLSGTGNALSNILRGDDSDDTLDGGLGKGSDVLYGGDGDDTYIVNVSADRVIERANQGTSDTVLTKLAAYTLGAYVENLTFTGGTIGHTGNGNSLNNTLTGDLLIDTLSGGNGNDRLDGGSADGAAIDVLIGGRGDDVYVMNSSTADTVVEKAKQGIDTVEVGALLHTYTLGVNVENLKSTSAVLGDVNVFTGNSADNVMLGGAANDTLLGLGGKDTLSGGLGSDTLDGGVGDDTLHGGLDADTFVFGAGYGKDVVLDFSGSITGGGDHINIHGFAAFTSYANLLTANAFTQSFDGIHIQLDATTNVTLLGLKLADIQASDFTFI